MALAQRIYVEERKYFGRVVELEGWDISCMNRLASDTRHQASNGLELIITHL